MNVLLCCLWGTRGWCPVVENFSVLYPDFWAVFCRLVRILMIFPMICEDSELFRATLLWFSARESSSLDHCCSTQSESPKNRSDQSETEIAPLWIFELCSVTYYCTFDFYNVMYLGYYENTFLEQRFAVLMQAQDQHSRCDFPVFLWLTWDILFWYIV